MPEFYHFDIPEPCNEDWNSMTPNEKGRFCSACNKSVVDFTQNTRGEILEYLSLHGNDGVCGRVTTKQLNYVTLKIPASFVASRTRQQHIFILLLLLVMGTTLFSCTSDQGSKTKIDNVEVVGLDSLEVISCSFGKDVDSLNNDEEIPIMGGMGTPPPEPPELTGEVLEVLQGDIVEEDHIAERIIPYQVASPLPKFKNSPEFDSVEEEKKYFHNRLTDFLKSNFNMSLIDPLNMDRVRVNARFVIDSDGQVIDIMARSKSLRFEAEAIRVLETLPNFINSSQQRIDYTFPVIMDTGK